MEIKMVLGQIREDTGPEGASRDPAKRQRVGGDLHYHVCNSVTKHARKNPLEIQGLGRGHRSWNVLASPPVGEGPEDPGFDPPHRKMLSISSEVVVFPLVPVIPIRSSAAAG